MVRSRIEKFEIGRSNFAGRRIVCSFDVNVWEEELDTEDNNWTLRCEVVVEGDDSLSVRDLQTKALDRAVEALTAAKSSVVGSSQELGYVIELPEWAGTPDEAP